ncbi:hypothetical protein EVAR_37449_1 [Eumeta japonica]|uniref:Uncharacterized protein n=1 Tax=Eumeta variegata TaxID=151549 RepID=A0A4C1X6N5_EUMVA|nr:hypothetical protein EVAR_37449_1 [Eumeta japonica]
MICTRCISHNFTEDQIRDESWIYHHNPETKKPSAWWVFSFEELPSKLERAQSVGKKTVDSFFRMTGMEKSILESSETPASDYKRNSSIWKNATLKNPMMLNPLEYGWEQQDTSYVFKWFEGDQLPRLISDFIKDVSDNSMTQVWNSTMNTDVEKTGCFAASGSISRIDVFLHQTSLRLQRPGLRAINANEKLSLRTRIINTVNDRKRSSPAAATLVLTKEKLAAMCMHRHLSFSTKAGHYCSVQILLNLSNGNIFSFCPVRSPLHTHTSPPLCRDILIQERRGVINSAAAWKWAGSIGEIPPLTEFEREVTASAVAFHPRVDHKLVSDKTYAYQAGKNQIKRKATTKVFSLQPKDISKGREKKCVSLQMFDFLLLRDVGLAVKGWAEKARVEWKESPRKLAQVVLAGWRQWVSRAGDVQ